VPHYVRPLAETSASGDPAAIWSSGQLGGMIRLGKFSEVPLGCGKMGGIPLKVAILKGNMIGA